MQHIGNTNIIMKPTMWSILYKWLAHDSVIYYCYKKKIILIINIHIINVLIKCA